MPQANYIWDKFRASAEALQGTKDWTQLSVRRVAPFGATKGVAILTSDDSTSGTYWVDDVRVTEQFPRNYLWNGGFEHELSGWSIVNGTGGTSAIDLTIAKEGNKSLRMTVAADVQYVFNSYDFGTNLAGRQFAASGYFKTSGLSGSEVALVITWLDAAGQMIWANSRSRLVTPSEDWNYFSVHGIAPRRNTSGGLYYNRGLYRGRDVLDRSR